MGNVTSQFFSGTEYKLCSNTVLLQSHNHAVKWEIFIVAFFHVNAYQAYKKLDTFLII